MQTQSNTMPTSPPLTPAILDGYGPVSHHVELAAMLIHEGICLDTGSTQPWLECTAVYRNTLRAGIEALVRDVPQATQF